MNRMLKRILVLSGALVLALAFTVPAFAAGDTDQNTPSEASGAAVEQSEGSTVGMKSIAAGLAIGIAAAGGAVGMGLATAKSAEGISRQPEAEGKIRTMMMLGLVFIETAIIYALLVVILIIFVL